MTITKKLVISLIVTFVVLIGEIVGGILSNSLALLSDAGHVFTDIFSLGMSLLALLIMKKPADKRATYGHHRTGILAALINGVSLIFMAIFIFWEAYKRIQSPLAIKHHGNAVDRAGETYRERCHCLYPGAQAR